MDPEAVNLLDDEGDAAHMAHMALELDAIPSPPRREAREREMLNAYNDLGAAKEVCGPYNLLQHCQGWMCSVVLRNLGTDMEDSFVISYRYLHHH